MSAEPHWPLIHLKKYIWRKIAGCRYRHDLLLRIRGEIGT
jgi:hypothetical protein